MVSASQSSTRGDGKVDEWRRKVRQCWDWVVDASLVFWICRVSLLSVLAGFALFLLVPQARDTFLEVRGAFGLWTRNTLFWILFFPCAVIFWALPVHYCARRDLDFDPINTDPERKLSPARHERVELISVGVPRILGAGCLFAIFLGAILASAGLRAPIEDATKLYDQAHLQARILGVTALATMLGLIYFFKERDAIAKAIASKGVKLDADFGRMVLTAMTILFFALLLLPISFVGNLSRAPLIPLLLGGWVPLLAWLAYKGRIYRAPLIVALFAALELFTIAGNNHDIRKFAIDRSGRPLATSENIAEAKVPKGVKRKSLNEKIAEWKEVVGCNDFEARREKCPVKPIVVAASGGASRAGFFTAAVLGELTDKTAAQPPKHRDFREQLFAISSVSGSSTGAAFFIAAILDSRLNSEDRSPPCRTDEPPSPLVHSQDAPTSWRACMQTLLSGDFLSSTLFAYLYKDALRGVAAMATYFGYETPDRAVVLEESWEKHYCRYTLNACDEDFSGLSRPFLNIFNPKRQVRRVPADLVSDEVNVSVPEKRQADWVPLLFLNTTDVDTGRRVIVSPVDPCSEYDRDGTCRLGERIFEDAYDLHQLIADAAGREGRDLGKLGYQFEALDAGKNYLLQEDIRLSTAAGLSARFPLVSPPGNVKNREGILVARIVDGGYFENFGAATALEIAQRLRRADLDPVMIEITNDPELLGASRVKLQSGGPGKTVCSITVTDPVCTGVPPIIDAGGSYLFSGIRGPLSGMFGARSAQGGRALLQLANSANTDKDKRNGCPPEQHKGHFIHIFVKPQYVLAGRETCEMVNVPMSWWLSKPVQAYLDHQIGEADLERATRFMEFGRQTGSQ